jgi:RNA polymerase sigma factor (sigma-70 family)
VDGDLDTLFRRESGRLTAALARRFGPHNLPLVEDVVHDALCRALEVWKFSGVPADPSAWLITAAKNRALDILRRERTARSFAPELERAISAFAEGAAEGDADPDEAVRDDQLRMMFACCHARLPEEVQVALILNLLGGFGVKEIAAAFLVGDSAMEKRLQRGKEVLGQGQSLLEVTSTPSTRRSTCSSTRGTTATTRPNRSASSCAPRRSG